MSGKRVLLAAPRSFCAGVDRAIEIVERLLEQNGPPVYVRHQIVHNEHVVRRLERLGAVFVEDESEIPEGEVCVLSAHGVAPSVKENAEARGLKVVDATCPLVNKVHAEARTYADSGHLVALVGHANHVEVIGTLGERPDSTVVVETPEQARALPTDRPIAVITQTTLSLDDVAPIVDALADHVGGSLRRPHADDICYATQNRQDAVKEMVELGATLIFVIGSENSSNAQRLVEVAKSAGAEATLVDGESPLDADLLDGHTTVGLTAGASTPEELVRATADRLAACGYDTLEEITVAREDVHFRLPREVARRMTSIEVPYSIAAALPTLSVMDITNDVSQSVARADCRAGIAYVHPLHSLTIVRVQERETGFFEDLEVLLERIVPSGNPNRERMVASLLSPRSEQVPFADGTLCLGPVPADHALLARCRASQRVVIDLARLVP